MQHPTTLDELCHVDSRGESWCATLDLHELGGSRMSAAAFAALDRFGAATALVISGLDQAGLESLIARCGFRFTAFHFWKCPRLEDLSPLEDVSNLSLVAFYWNQRATRLWDLQRTPQLRGLAFEDFSRLHDLYDLQAGESLEELRFGNKVWAKAMFDSLAPVSTLARLRRLSFVARRIGDGRIQPLANLTQLATLDFPPGQFTTEQIAWLRARLPDSVRGRSLGPLHQIAAAFGVPGALGGDVLPVGRGKRILDSTRDAAKIARHVEKFEALVRSFREDPAREPAPR